MSGSGARGGGSSAGERRVVVARVDDIPDGSRVIVDVGGRSIGIFNVAGRYYGMLNRCPHKAAELCRGDVLDLVVSDEPGEFRLDSGVKLLVCPWHGWQYDLATGQSWSDPGSGRARPLEVNVERGATIARDVEAGTTDAPVDLDGIEIDPQTRRVRGPYTAEVVPVSVDGDYVVISLRGLATARSR
jgi:nitrite reductase/ring-hydroxylating ferredoxin subunit